MKKLSLAIYWHMHQPVYEIEGTYLMPWARLHAVKDYLDMILVLEKFPKLKLNFDVVPALMDKFKYKSVMQVPKLEKIVINMGVSDVKDNSKALDIAMKDLETISGQKPLVTKARKSIAAFKLREGMNIGCKVTLRREKMYDFATRLFNVALPRVRDFKGVPAKSFDGRGNYAFGIKEQMIFPEIEFDKVDKARGMDVIFVTTAKSDEEAKALLEMLGLPFAKN